VNQAEELKRFDGVWLLKSIQETSGPGTYAQNQVEGDELVFRIRDGVMEMQSGEEQWSRYGTLSLGTVPECLRLAVPDAAGQLRTLQLRYKFEGNTLITVQDSLCPEALPDSFELDKGIVRQLKKKIYEKTKP
jgi:hypothetical protein